MAQPLGQAAHRALPLGIVGGFLYLLIWMGKQTADVQLEREKEAIIEASKTPEQRAAEAAAREAEAVQRRAEMRQQLIGLHVGDRRVSCRKARLRQAADGAACEQAACCIALQRGAVIGVGLGHGG